jgi:hypothetical protein
LLKKIGYNIDMKFEYMKQSWFKRRTPTEVIPELVEFDVNGVKKAVGSKCKITVRFDNSEAETLDGIVHVQKTFRIGGEEIIHFWYVSGSASNGMNLSFKIIE